MKILKTLLQAFLVLLASNIPDFAQSVGPPVSVSEPLLRKHVFLLASDSLQGRQTGTAGQLLAAFYAQKIFRQNHLIPVFRMDSVRGSFRQTYPFTITEVANFGRTEVANFGRKLAYGAPNATYKRYELATTPVTPDDSSRVLFGDNVAGLLVGTDLKQEVVVLSAHYDHLGTVGKRVFHGADDNASGTATILSLTAVFDSLARQGIRPRRSILFVLFSGEEGGLLGSAYFLNNSPIPLPQLVCDFNVDMVGRVDYAHRKKPDYCYLITGNQGDALKTMAETANGQSVNLALNDGGYDAKADPEHYFLRSDHYNFAKLGIPALFFTNGQHPDYHQTSDTAEKIVYDVLQKRATLIFQTAWLAANPAL